MTLTPGSAGKPSEHAPPGYRFRVQFTETVDREAALARAARMFACRAEELHLSPGSFLPKGGDMKFPWYYHPHGWMVFSR